MEARMNELRIGMPLVTGKLTVVPVETVRWGSHSADTGFSVFGAKEAVAVVLVTDRETRALDLSGAEVKLAELIQDVPSLQEFLNGRLHATARFDARRP
jgi:hypothetical protein